MTTAFDEDWKDTRQAHVAVVCPAATGVNWSHLQGQQLDDNLRKAHMVANPHYSYRSGLKEAPTCVPSSGQLLSAASKRLAHHNTQPSFGVSQSLASAALLGCHDRLQKPASVTRQNLAGCCDVLDAWKRLHTCAKACTGFQDDSSGTTRYTSPQQKRTAGNS